MSKCTRCLLAAVACVAASCAGNPSSPSSTLKTTSEWNYEAVLERVEGSDCVAGVLRTFEGTSETGRLVMSQDGASAHAVVTDAGSHQCDYSGNMTSTLLSLSMTKCVPPPTLTAICGDGRTYSVVMTASTIAANLERDHMNGQQTQVYAVSSVNGEPAMTFSAINQFSLTRR